jgi:type I restriction enzyme M protein
MLGDAEAQAQDVLGRVYEYFLGQYALAEGKKGGQFYTPESIVRLLVEILEPYKGRVEFISAFAVSEFSKDFILYFSS